jgi:hypothetical protein
LVDVIAGEPIRSGDEHKIKRSGGDGIAQRVESWSPHRSTAHPRILIDVLSAYLPSLLMRCGMRVQPFELLLNAMLLSLAGG